VRRQVQQAARASCRGDDFEHCVAMPMWTARRDTTVSDPAGSQDR
jgi:hypothetical protein